MSLGKITLVAMLGSMLLSSVQGFSQSIIAHRGASYQAPENTIASVKLGFELTEAVEIDIHLTRDKKIVVNHDHTTTRTSPGSDFIISETISDSLRVLDVGSWKDEKYKGEKIPFIEDVFKVVPKNKTLVIEVKGNTDVLPYLQAAVEKSGKKDQFTLISFNKDAVIQWKQNMPEMPVFWLLHNFNEISMNEAISIAKNNKLDGLNVYHELIDSQFMEAMEAAQLKVYVYTVNDQEIAQKLKAAKVDGITTDRPEYIAESLK